MPSHRTPKQKRRQAIALHGLPKSVSDTRLEPQSDRLAVDCTFDAKQPRVDGYLVGEDPYVVQDRLDLPRG